MARFILYADRLDSVDAKPLLADLGDDVADDMRRLAPVDTGDMVSTVRVGAPSATKIVVRVGGIKGKITGKPVDYVPYVERGTSRMAAQPFMAPATYRYRSP